MRKSRLGLIILTIIIKELQKEATLPPEMVLSDPCCLLTQSKTIQMVCRLVNIMFEVHY